MAWENSNQGPTRTSKPPMDPRAIVVTLIIAIIVVIAYRTGHVTNNSLVYFAVVIPSIILHEISHGWVAHMFGDPTAKNAGRLTLNPIRHVDPIGTFILPGLLLLSQAGIAFGYAKPVPVNTAAMSRNKSMLVSLAGPFTNILISLIAAVAFNTVYTTAVGESTTIEWVLRTLFYLGLSNVALAVFNLIPIPPLDGSAVVERFLPYKYWPQYLKLRQYSMILLLVIMLFFNQIIGRIFDPFIEAWTSLLSGQ